MARSAAEWPALDQTFDGDGVVEIPVSYTEGHIAAGSGGESYVLLSPGFLQTQLVVHRLLSDGTPDPLFGVGGRAAVSLGSRPVTAVIEVDVAPDGALVVLFEYGYPNGTLALVKIAPTGSVDAAFGVGGFRDVSAPNAVGSCAATSFEFDPSGRVLVSSRFGCFGTTASLAAYSSTGVVDAGFGSGGTLSTPCDGDFGVQSDSRIVYAGCPVNGRVSALRYLANGTPDGSFSIDPLPDYGNIYSVRVRQTDDGLILAGYIPGLEDVWAFYNSDGSVDTSRPPVARLAEYVTTVGAPVSPAGSIFEIQRYSPNSRQYVSRTLSNGERDVTWADRGLLKIPTDGYYVEQPGSWHIDTSPSGQLMLAAPVYRSYGNGDGYFALAIFRFELGDGGPVVAPESRTGHPVGGVTIADPVDTATGNLVDVHVDLTAPTFAMDLTRSYNGLATEPSPLGLRWRIAGGAQAYDDAGAVLIVYPDGTRFEYVEDGLGGYITPPGATAALATDARPPSGGGSLPMLSLVHTDGTTVRFDTRGLAVERDNWDGQSTALTYDNNGLLQLMQSSAGPRIELDYDLQGRLTGAESDTGEHVAYAYDLDGRLASVTDIYGAETTYAYTATDLLASATDATGVDLMLNTYDVEGRVVTQTGPDGGVTTFEYFPADAITRVSDSVSGETVEYRHDPDGKVVAIIDPTGDAVVRAYDARHNLVGASSRTERFTTATYDAANNVTSITRPGAGTTTFEYDQSHRVITTTDPWGGVTTYTYDGDERIPSSTTDALNHTSLTDVVDGLVMSTTDADGVTTTFTYDSARRLLTSTDELGNDTEHTYNARGQQETLTTPEGNETTWAYDADGRAQSVTAPDGGITSYTYDDAGRVLTVTDATMAVTTSVYDAAGNLATTTDSGGHVTTYGYDANGRQVTSQAPEGGVTATSYGELGRVESMEDPLERVTSYGYNIEGEQTTVANPNDEVVETIYDEFGRTASTKDAAGRETAYTLDANGRVDSTTAAGSATTSYTYDAAGRVETVTDPRGGVTATTYTPAGRVATVTDPAGVTLTYGYDDAGRRTSVEATGGRVTAMVLDGDGKVLSTTSPEGNVTSYTYDEMGRELTVTDPAGVVTTKTWSLRGELLTSTTGAEGTVTYAYNPDGTLDTVTDSLGEVSSFGYDDNGNRTTVTDALGGVQTWEYNAADELVAYRDQLDRQTTYTYDDAGRVATVTDPTNRTTTLTYHPDGQIATRIDSDGVTSDLATYAYDPAGRLDTITDAAGVYDYDYTPSGDLVRYETAAGRVTTWGYDAAGRRTAMTTPTGETLGYTYRPDGLLDEITADVAPAMGARLNTFDKVNDSPPYVADLQLLAWNGGHILIGDVLALNVGDFGDNYALIRTASPTAVDADSDVTFSYQFTDLVNSDLTMRVIAREAGNGPTAESVYVDISDASSTGTVYEKVNDVTTAIGTFPAPASYEKRQLRLELDGSTIHIRTWDDDDPEPITWDFEGTVTPAADGPITIVADRIVGLNRVIIDNLLISNALPVTSGERVIAAYDYDLDGNLTTETLLDGARSRTYTDGQVTTYEQTLPGANVTTTLTYDSTGRVATTTSNGATDTYAYDDASQLIQRNAFGGVKASYEYDALGRRTHSVEWGTAVDYRYDAAGQLCWTAPSWTNPGPTCADDPTGETRYTHDGAGRLLTETTPAGDVTSYTYGNAGRLADVTTDPAAAAPSSESRTYSPTGNLVGLDGDYGPTTIDWDINQAVPEPTGYVADNTTIGLVDGPAGWAAAHLYNDYRTVALDHQGSVVPRYGLETISASYGWNTTDGWYDASHAYRAYGTTQMSDIAMPNWPYTEPRIALGYRGELTVDGLIHLRARDYRPDLGQFTTRDPLTGVGGTTTINNAYHYADNDPINRTDPNGLYSTGDGDFAVDYPIPASRTLTIQTDQRDWKDYGDSALDAALAIPGGITQMWTDVNGMVHYVTTTGEEIVASRTAGMAGGLLTAMFTVVVHGALTGDCPRGATCSRPDDWITVDAETGIAHLPRHCVSDERNQPCPQPDPALDADEPGYEPTIVYRALNADDDPGRGLFSKVPPGTPGEWTVQQHYALGSGEDAKYFDVWIATTVSISVARRFDSGYGIVAIDLNLLEGAGYEMHYGPDSGSPFKWQQEWAIKGNIPWWAMMEGWVEPPTRQ